MAALLLVAAVVFALPVGRRPLYNQDEVRYAILARDVAENGHWFLPRVRDQIYLNKPPLFFWAVALVSLPAGRVSDVTGWDPLDARESYVLQTALALGRLDAADSAPAGTAR